MDEQQQHGRRNENIESFPDSLKCIVTSELVTDPCVVSKCVCSTHHRNFLEKWVQENGRCPSCNTQATLADIRANISTRHAIQHFAPAAYTAAVLCNIRQAIYLGNFTSLVRIMNDNDENAHLAHKDTVGIQREAVHRLSEYLTMASAENKAQLIESNCIPAILKAMRGHKDDSFLQKRGCVALFHLVMDDSGDGIKPFHRPHCDAVARSGALNTVLEAMKTHAGDEGVQEAGCMAMVIFPHSIVEWPVVELGMPVIFAAMKKYLRNSTLQRHGCEIINLHSDALQRADSVDAVDAILDAMKEHTGCCLVEHSCLEALKALTEDSAAINNRFADASGISAALATIKKHPQIPRLLSAASSVLWNVSCFSIGNDELHCNMIVGAGGISVLLETMQNHWEQNEEPNTIDIQENCVSVLKACSDCSLDYQDLIINSGGIPIIFAAVHTFLDSERLRAEGLELLAELLQCGEAHMRCPLLD